MTPLSVDILNNYVSLLDRSGASFNQNLQLSKDGFDELVEWVRDNDAVSIKIGKYVNGNLNYKPAKHSALLEGEWPVLIYSNFSFKIIINNNG